MSSPRIASKRLLALVVLLPVFACKSAEEWSAAADDDVYALVAERRAELGLPGEFTVAPAPNALRLAMDAGERPERLKRLSLVDCQRLASGNSRAYQARREALYLSALDLSLARYNFGQQIDVSGGASLTGDQNGAQGVGTDGNVSLTKVLGNGATVVLDLGGSLFKSLASGSPGDFISDLSLTITRPLLAGSTNEAIFEPLTRSERRVADEARSYERFRRSFGVDVFSRYWRILEQHEVVTNEGENVKRLALLRERNEALSEAGRMDDIQAGQATQDELRARSRLIRATSQLEGLYDDFKFFMGLPVGLPIRLDRNAFEGMAKQGIESITITAERAIDLALVERLDLATTRDRLGDAQRAVRIAKDDLGSRLDLVVNGGATSDVEPGFDFQAADVDWSVGLDYNLAVDRFGERNAYRAVQIAEGAAERALTQAEDQLRIDVRADLRDLAQAREDFSIQENSVLLAERRVESTELKLDAGRAQTRDLLEARSSLVAAQNARVSALVDYKLARLRLLFDMDELQVDENGVRARDPEILTPPVAASEEAK